MKGQGNDGIEPLLEGEINKFVQARDERILQEQREERDDSVKRVKLQIEKLEQSLAAAERLLTTAGEAEVKDQIRNKEQTITDAKKVLETTELRRLTKKEIDELSQETSSYYEDEPFLQSNLEATKENLTQLQQQGKVEQSVIENKLAEEQRALEQQKIQRQKLLEKQKTIGKPTEREGNQLRENQLRLANANKDVKEATKFQDVIQKKLSELVEKASVTEQKLEVTTAKLKKVSNEIQVLEQQKLDLVKRLQLEGEKGPTVANRLGKLIQSRQSQSSLVNRVGARLADNKDQVQGIDNLNRILEETETKKREERSFKEEFDSQQKKLTKQRGRKELKDKSLTDAQLQVDSLDERKILAMVTAVEYKDNLSMKLVQREENQQAEVNRLNSSIQIQQASIDSTSSTITQQRAELERREEAANNELVGATHALETRKSKKQELFSRYIPESSHYTDHQLYELEEKVGLCREAHTDIEQSTQEIQALGRSVGNAQRQKDNVMHSLSVLGSELNLVTQASGIELLYTEEDIKKLYGTLQRSVKENYMRRNNGNLEGFKEVAVSDEQANQIAWSINRRQDSDIVTKILHEFGEFCKEHISEELGMRCIEYSRKRQVSAKLDKIKKSVKPFTESLKAASVTPVSHISKIGQRGR